MRVVVLLAVAALGALILALVSGSTLAAISVVMLALVGIVVLLRDWRAERAAAPVPDTAPAGPVDEPAGTHEPLTPDEFSPDIAGSDQI
ncbi:MAG: hypothetical protein ACOYBX_05385 [Mycobacterium sp.]|jgi:uncharacterized membrane protein YfcA